MIEIKGNTIIITVDNKKEKFIFKEIVDFINTRKKSLNGKRLLKLIEDYHKIDKDFKFDREKIYYERLHIH